MCAVLCLCLIWPTSLHYFPINSCLSSTSVPWDGGSRLCGHTWIRKISVKSQYSRWLPTSQLSFLLWRASSFKKSANQQNRKMCGLQLVHWLEVFASWIMHRHSALCTKCLISNYLCAFLSSFYMPSRYGSNNYSVFINLLDSTAAAWSDLLFIRLV